MRNTQQNTISSLV